MITKRSKQTLKNRVRFEINSKTKIQNHCFARVHYPVLKPPRTATPSRRHTAGPQARRASNRARQKPGVAIREPKSASAPPRHPPHDRRGKANDIFHTSNPSTRDHRAGRVRTGRRTASCILRRKEVIQPHLPVRLPCYDLVPITSLTLDGSIPQGVRPPASGAAHFHDLTGGVYKARERIHRDVADSRLLATPPSRSRVADCDPN